MSNTHLAHPDLAIDKFFGTDPDQDVESFIQSIERKIKFALGDAPGVAGELTNYTFRKKPQFFLYSEDQLLSGTTITLPTLLLGRMSEPISPLDFQTDETNFEAEWRWNIVLEEMENIFETFYTVSNERLIKAGPVL